MGIRPVVSGRCVAWSHLSPLALTIFVPPLPHRSLNLKGSGLIKKKKLPLNLCAPEFPSLGILTICEPLCKLPSIIRRSFSDQD